jgi:integrase
MKGKTMATIEKTETDISKQCTNPIPNKTKAKIVEFSFWMLKEGFAESTIISRTKLLKILSKRGANLLDPESVKETIAKQKCWSEGRKVNAVNAYTSYLIMTGGKWEPPRYKRIKKIPFIPTEAEIDQLIAGCGPKTATLLQLLKETGMRIGEAWKLKWTEIDNVNNTVRVTPEKGSNPRIFKLSGKMMAMLDSMQRRTTNNRVFSECLKSKRRLFEKQRATLARKLKNPRIKAITFHTMRHFKATMEYHRTKDILYVMRILGHKNIKNTLIYTQLLDFQDDDYVSRVAKTVQEACQLVESGFEYVCEMDDVKIFRKRK